MPDGACMRVVWGTPPLALNGGSGTDAVSGFVCLAVHTASQSDLSFVNCHEKTTSIVWSDQSDSRFTAGSLSALGCTVSVILCLTGQLGTTFCNRWVPSDKVNRWTGDIISSAPSLQRYCD